MGGRAVEAGGADQEGERDDDETQDVRGFHWDGKSRNGSVSCPRETRVDAKEKPLEGGSREVWGAEASRGCRQLPGA